MKELIVRLRDCRVPLYNEWEERTQKVEEGVDGVVTARMKDPLHSIGIQILIQMEGRDGSISS